MKRIVRRTAGGWLAALLFLLTPLLASAQPSASRERMEKSAGWGVDRATGNIVVDASLLVLYDAIAQTLVVNPNYYYDAVTETGAVVQQDGRWLMPDGNVLRPLLGTAAIVVGDEPAGLLEASGLPAIAYDRVNVTDAVGYAAADPAKARAPQPQGGPAVAALKVKHSQRCAGCYQGCGFTGCYKNELYSAASGYHGNCEFKLFHRCKQEWRPACRIDLFTCDNCQGSVQEVQYTWMWQCSGGC
jgi:hypothetical protein